MKTVASVRTNVQKQLFSEYHSLNLQDKLYQVKALKLATKYLDGHKKDIKLLDIGCADGSFASYAGHELNAKTYGIDISPEAIAKAKKTIDHATQHDISKSLPYPDKSFEIIFALEVIEHIYDTDFLISEIRRILKPGGILVVSTPNLASIKNRVRLLFNNYPQYLEYSTAGAGHIHLYTSEVLLTQLSSHKLTVRSLTSANFLAPYVTHPKAPNLYRDLAMLIGDWLPTLGSHIIAVVQR